MGGNGTFHALLVRDGPLCHYCGRYLWESIMTKEHIVPRSLGGPSVMDNYVLSCAPCNHARSNLNAPHKGCTWCLRARDAYGHHTPVEWKGHDEEPAPVSKSQRARRGIASAAMIAARKRAESVVGHDMLTRAGQWPGSAPKVDGHKEA